MLKEIRPAIVLLLLFSALTGLAYPLAITGLAELAFPWQAGGSLIERNGAVIGSALIGQNLSGNAYFHGRPSATTDTDPNDPGKTVPAPYNAANSSGSNAGPTNRSFIEGVKAEVGRLRAENDRPVPVDLVTASGSGLDPDISLAAAAFQIPRVAKARHMAERDVAALVERHTVRRVLGVLGEPHVNVLRLNLALDSAAGGGSAE
ncbi:MAG: potassium-transporting ATPase subunit KdpC [Alphaproteobacteria bacterium]